MGHRRHSAPRRGSLAYLPRGRAKSMEARIRAWPKVNTDEPKLLAHAGFKAGCVQIVNIDDREKTPNHGKQLVSLGTVIVTPPILIVGIRGYSKDPNGKHAKFDLYADNLPKNISKLFKNKDKESLLDYTEKSIKKAETQFNKYGIYSLLFAWLPVVGDPLTVVGGIFRVKFSVFLILVALGKGARYLAVLAFAVGLEGLL